MKEEQVFNPDIDLQLNAPQIDRNLYNANPIAPEAIMEKLAFQQTAEKEYAAKRMEALLKGIEEKKEIAVNVEHIQDSSSKDFKTALTAKYPEMKKAEELVDYKKEEEFVPISVPTTGSIKERIQEMESRLGIDHSIGRGVPKTNQAKSFFDDFGEETFYVKNVSNGIVVISDLDRGSNGSIGENKIARGATVDLLTQYDLETIKKSRELRMALSGRGTQLLLKRLTPEEYLAEITRQAIDQEKIEQFKVMAELKASIPGQNKAKKAIRPVIESKLLQLQLSYSDTPNKGITPVEFIQWVNTEKLTLDELEYILSGVDDKDIRMFVHAKKQDLL